MKIVATVEARMASSRLPGKILKDLAGQPSLQRLVERVRRSKYIQDVIIATTVAPSDDITEEACKKMGVKVFRGSSDDVLDRVLQAAKSGQADVIVELTGDCPLLDPQLIDDVISRYLEGGHDYVSNNLERTFPRGMDTQIFSVKVLDEVSKLTQDPADREHVSLYIYEHPERYRLSTIKAADKFYWPDLRLTVDTPEDYQLISKIYESLYSKNPAFGLAEILEFLEQNPALLQMNAHIMQKPVR